MGSEESKLSDSEEERGTHEPHLEIDLRSPAEASPLPNSDNGEFTAFELPETRPIPSVSPLLSTAPNSTASAAPETHESADLEAAEPNSIKPKRKKRMSSAACRPAALRPRSPSPEVEIVYESFGTQYNGVECKYGVEESSALKKLKKSRRKKKRFGKKDYFDMYGHVKELVDFCQKKSDLGHCTHTLGKIFKGLKRSHVKCIVNGINQGEGDSPNNLTSSPGVSGDPMEFGAHEEEISEVGNDDVLLINMTEIEPIQID